MIYNDLCTDHIGDVDYLDHDLCIDFIGDIDYLDDDLCVDYIGSIDDLDRDLSEVWNRFAETLRMAEDNEPLGPYLLSWFFRWDVHTTSKMVKIPPNPL